MAFPAEIIRGGVQILNNLTKGVQMQVVQQPWIGQNLKGKPVYGTSVTLQAVVDTTRRNMRKNDGQIIDVKATLYFLTPIPHNGTAGRLEPIDPRDVLLLADGTTGPIVSAPGMISDPGTNDGFVTIVALGY